MHPRDRVEMCAAALSPSSHTEGLYKVHHNTVGVTDQGAGSIGAIPGIGLFVDHTRFASTHASVYQEKSQYYGKVSVTRYIIGGILYPKGLIAKPRKTLSVLITLARRSNKAKVKY
jgi:hypothetical protein